LPEQALRIRIIATGLLGIMVAALIFKLFKTGMFGIQPVQIYQLFLITGFITTATILLSILLRKGISVSLAIYLLFLPAIIFLVVMNMLQRVG